MCLALGPFSTTPLLACWHQITKEWIHRTRSRSLVIRYQPSLTTFIWTSMYWGSFFSCLQAVCSHHIAFRSTPCDNRSFDSRCRRKDCTDIKTWLPRLSSFHLLLPSVLTSTITAPVQSKYEAHATLFQWSLRCSSPIFELERRYLFDFWTYGRFVRDSRRRNGGIHVSPGLNFRIPERSILGSPSSIVGHEVLPSENSRRLT